ncbi:MAG: heme-binding protein, partial [Pseudomonadota bacterium]|nr:heme-binding protein [Pseudomonadota bacterium]
TAYATKHGWHLAIWVIDGSGTPLAFRRMDGAGTLAVATSKEKAQTALELGHPSGDLSQGLAQGHLDILSLGLFAMSGGLPITADGQIVGAIGAGGAQSSHDEECAQAGLDAVLGKK